MLTEEILNNHPLFVKLNSLELESNEYIIMGSGIMFALGIRKLEGLDDIDILVPKTTWEKVKSLSENIFDPEWNCSHLIKK